LPATAACVLATPLLDSLSAAFPRVDFHVSVANTDVLVEGMLKGSVDIAMINPVPDGRLFHRNLLVEDLVVVGGAASNLQPSHAIEFPELVDFPLILPACRSQTAAGGRRHVATRTADWIRNEGQ
jgi:DNA-binding transcriptional LysR family regulator